MTSSTIARVLTIALATSGAIHCASETPIPGELTEVQLDNSISAQAITGASIIGASVTGASLTGASIIGASVIGASVRGAS